jgi:UDP-N-acetylglucosamine acyltransferase
LQAALLGTRHDSVIPISYSLRTRLRLQEFLQADWAGSYSQLRSNLYAAGLPVAVTGSIAMSRPQCGFIHPTAIISAQAQLAEDVRVGPYAVIEGDVTIGPGTIIRPHAHLIGSLSLGSNNDVGTGVVLGAAPQQLAYQGEPTSVVIGDGNIFREYSTVHRGMPAGTGLGTSITRIGNRNFFMVGSHAAHDCVIGNDCFFANNAALAGHVQVGDRALISGNSAVHQFCRVGRLALLSGASATSKDMPPFWVMQDVNCVRGINTIGMRRAGMMANEIQAVRKSFAFIYIDRLPIPAALLRMEAEFGHVPAVRELIEFIRTSKRGICGAHRFNSEDDQIAA